MTRKTRRIIFYIFLVLFLLFAALIILYAQGYSFDFEKKSVVITGAFYLKSIPKRADIYINNEYRGKTNKFIRRLSPKEYEIRVSQPGYYDWQKKLKIESKLITEAKNILLIKKSFTLGTVMEYSIKDYFLSKDGQKIIYLTDGSTKDKKLTYSSLSLRLLDLLDNSDQQIYPLDANNKLDLKNLLSITWSSDNEKIILSFSSGYYILDIKKSQLIDLNKIAGALIKNPLFHPENSGIIYFIAENNLFVLNIFQGYFSLIASDILTFSIDSHGILYIYSDGSFYKTNLDGSSFSKIFDIPLIKSKAQKTLIINDRIIIIDNNLYFYNSQNQIFKKLADNIEGVSFSKDNEKMLWINHNQIGVIWFNKYEEEIIIESPGEIKQAIWYSGTDEHIIFVENDKAKIVEIDSRDKRNVMNILSLEDAKIFYREKDDELYIFSKDQLYKTRLNNK